MYCASSSSTARRRRLTAFTTQRRGWIHGQGRETIPGIVETRALFFPLPLSSLSLSVRRPPPHLYSLGHNNSHLASSCPMGVPIALRTRLRAQQPLDSVFPTTLASLSSSRPYRIHALHALPIRIFVHIGMYILHIVRYVHTYYSPPWLVSSCWSPFYVAPRRRWREQPRARVHPLLASITHPLL